MLYIDLWPGQTCHSSDGGSCIFRWRRRAWLTIWDSVKIPRYSHKLMHRTRVICELHDSYFRSLMIKTCHSKDGGSCIFRWQFMGRDWVGDELLYNSVHRKFNQSWRNYAVEKIAPSRRGPWNPRLSSWGSDELERRCWIEEHVPERLGPQAPGWAAQENGKETQLWPIEWGSICCSSVRSPTYNTQPFQIKWEVYFSKNCVVRLYCVVVMHLHMSMLQLDTTSQGQPLISIRWNLVNLYYNWFSWYINPSSIIWYREVRDCDLCSLLSKFSVLLFLKSFF